MAVTDSFEVVLGGVRFRTIGGIFRSPASQWAAKVTQGDTDRNSDPHRSTLAIVGDLRGGGGLDHIEGAGDSNRTWFSTHDTRHLNHLLHLPLAVGPASAQYSGQRTIPMPSSNEALADISFIVDYENELYVGFGTKVYKWNETSNIWSTLEHTLPATPTSVLRVRIGDARSLYLLVACGDNGYAYFDGAMWTNKTDHKVNWFIEWDAQLWSLDNTGQLAKAPDPAEAWVDDAWLPLPNGFASALLITKGVDNIYKITVISKDGALWLHDATNMKFIRTSLELPIHPDTGLGTISFREATYIPSGLAINKFDVGSVSNPVSLVGLDQDAGLPTDRTGRIVQLLRSQTSLIAFVEGSITPVAIPRLSGGVLGSLPPLVYSVSRNKSTIMERTKGAWHTLWAGGQDGEAPADRPRLITGHVSDAYGKYRLWFGTGIQLWYIDLPRYVVNPSQLPMYDYAYRAETISPWFNAGVAGAHKVALNVLAELRNLAVGGPTIMVEFACNYDEDVWHQVLPEDYDGEGDPPHYTYNSNDLHDPHLIPDCTDTGRDPETGTPFRSSRIRISSVLGPNQHLSPDLRSLTFEYYKRLGIKQKYQWTMTLDLSEPYGNYSPRQLADKLTEIVGMPEMSSFNYDRDQTHYVKVFQEGRFGFTGTEAAHGQANLVLVEL